MPVRSRLLKSNIMEKTAGYFLLPEIFPDAKGASLIMIDRMAWTFVIRACAEFFRLFHFAASFSVSPVSR